MRIPSKAFLVDLDDTLMDTKMVRSIIEDNFYTLTGKNPNILWDTFDKVRDDKGFADYQEISQQLSEQLGVLNEKISTIFYQSSFEKCLKPGAVDLLKYLQTLGKVIIFSHGHFEFQFHKLKTSGIEKLLNGKNLLIFENKKEQIDMVIKKLRGEGIINISFIDDRADILDQAYLCDKSIHSFWIRKSENEQLRPKTSCITFQSDGLNEIYNYIYESNTLSEIKDKKSVQVFKIKYGISPNQVRQLITYTSQDPDIKKFTSDLENRFANLKMFNTWLKDHDFIYSLVDDRDNLMGIFWLREKPKPDLKYIRDDLEHYQITFGIRMYGSARGKGLSKQFMHIALLDYKKSPEYKLNKNNGFWDVVDKDNITSIKFHESFGFRAVTKDQNQDKIVFIYE